MRTRGVVPLAAVLLAAASLAASEEAVPDPFDRLLRAQLEELNPAAAATFDQANQARQAGDHEKASRLYGEIEALVPAFSHAVRRHAYEELELGHPGVAIDLMRKAVGLEESALNLAGLARVLNFAGVSGAYASESLRLAGRASEMDPAEESVQFTLCESALSNSDIASLQLAVERLQKVHPDKLTTLFCQSFLHAFRGEFGAAGRSLAKARAVGLPEDQYRAILKSFQDAKPLSTRILEAGSRAGAIWAGVFALLFLLGWILSRVALLEARRASGGTSTGRAEGLSLVLRRFYSLVLWLSCAFYYVSIPFVLVSVLAVGGGLIYAMLAIGRIPLKLAAIIVILTCVTLWAVLKSILVRRRDTEPGMRLQPGSYPGLRGVLDEVASRIGTRPVDNVYLTPGTDLAVMERGGRMLLRGGGRSERCLILGAGVLEGMKLSPFKAILGHEYGHFSNRDTAGGSFSLSVRSSLLTMAANLAQGGAAAWYNPAWLFFQGFYRVFLVISQGATRLQEVLADRWAAACYGAGAFEEGLRHVIRRSIAFSDHVNRTLQEVVERRLSLANLYTFSPGHSLGQADLDSRVEAIVNEPPSLYDSHPSPADRFRWVRAVMPEAPAAGTVGEANDDDIWSLLGDRITLERDMTGLVRETVFERYGHRIPAAPEDVKQSVWD